MTYTEASTSRLRDHIAAAGRNRPCASIDADPEAWFPVGRPSAKVDLLAAGAEARRLCAGCPVTAACLELALRYEAGSRAYGVWDGLTPWQRDDINPYRRTTQPSSENEKTRAEVAA